MNEKKPASKEEVKILEEMISSLTDLLIEKGIITDEEYNKKVKDKIKQAKELKDADDLE